MILVSKKEDTNTEKLIFTDNSGCTSSIVTSVNIVNSGKLHSLKMRGAYLKKILQSRSAITNDSSPFKIRMPST
jgi:hypothetical protein